MTMEPRSDLKRRVEQWKSAATGPYRRRNTSLVPRLSRSGVVNIKRDNLDELYGTDTMGKWVHTEAFLLRDHVDFPD